MYGTLQGFDSPASYNYKPKKYIDMRKTYGLFFYIVSRGTGEKLHAEIVYTNPDLNTVKSVLQDQIASAKDKPFYVDDISAFFKENEKTIHIWVIK